MSNVSLSLPALTGEVVYDLIKDYYLTQIALAGAAGQRIGAYSGSMYEMAKDFAKENQLVFEQSKLTEFCEALAQEAKQRFNENHTFKQIKDFYKVPYAELLPEDIPAFMRS